MALALASSAKASSPIPTVHRQRPEQSARAAVVFALCCGVGNRAVRPGGNHEPGVAQGTHDAGRGDGRRAYPVASGAYKKLRVQAVPQGAAGQVERGTESRDRETGNREPEIGNWRESACRCGTLGPYARAWHFFNTETQLVDEGVRLAGRRHEAIAERDER